jgi:hypothetical protein
MALRLWMALPGTASARTKPALFSIGLLLLGIGTIVATEQDGVVNKVTLELQIQGLSKEGCVVEISPGHPACKFKKVKYKVEDSRVLLQPIEVTSLSIDRDCSFAITIKEPGLPEHTIRRGLRLSKPTEGTDTKPELKITCHLATPSQVQQARNEGLNDKPKSR